MWPERFGAEPIMQDPGYEFPRILLPRTPVNKGRKKGRGCYHAPAPLLRECFLSLQTLLQLLNELAVTPSPTFKVL
jgi:hypothetical protein